jgi:hypothetical protein
MFMVVKLRMAAAAEAFWPKEGVTEATPIPEWCGKKTGRDSPISHRNGRMSLTAAPPFLSHMRLARS